NPGHDYAESDFHGRPSRERRRDRPGAGTGGAAQRRAGGVPLPAPGTPAGAKAGQRAGVPGLPGLREPVTRLGARQPAAEAAVRRRPRSVPALRLDDRPVGRPRTRPSPPPLPAGGDGRGAGCHALQTAHGRADTPPDMALADWLLPLMLLPTGEDD